MITAIDSSVVLDVLIAQQRFAESSGESLRAAYRAGPVVACGPVWAEVRAFYENDGAHAAAMAGIGIEFDGSGVVAAARAGALWRQYRRQGGKRMRILADFLIGAHALEQADALLTRDTGFYRTYFGSLRLVTPGID